MRVVSRQLRIDNDTGQLMQIHCYCCQRRIVQTELDRHRLKGCPAQRSLLKSVQLSLGECQTICQLVNQLIEILTAFFDDPDNKGGFIGSENTPLSIDNLAACRRYHLNPDAVPVRLGEKILMLGDLQRVIAVDQHQQQQADPCQRGDQPGSVDHPFPSGISERIKGA